MLRFKVSKQKSECPLYRREITKILYLHSQMNGSETIIKIGEFHKRINNINDINKLDSKICIICLKSDFENQLLLCTKCNYNLTHLVCW